MESLAHPPSGEALLEYSEPYRHKKQVIEAKLALISDSQLREKLSSEEWAKVDKAALEAEEEVKLRTEAPAAMRACLLKHRGDWFEIGHVRYSGQNQLAVDGVPASPIEWNPILALPIDIKTMDSVYSQFREITRQQILQQATDAWISDQSCIRKLTNFCRNMGGTPDECSSPSELEEARRALGSVDCNDNPSRETGWNLAETAMRDQRLILVGQGDTQITALTA